MDSTPPTSSEMNEVDHHGFKVGDQVQFQRQDQVAKGELLRAFPHIFGQTLD